NFKKVDKQSIIERIPYLKEKYQQTRRSKKEGADIRWIMGQLRNQALGNINLSELQKHITS
ncbi:MAG: hypothetical protein GX437_04375, partial [Sphingobacteriales bacterium]|nr:hypothetical protein [Sphingobacteriales bacterium]